MSAFNILVPIGEGQAIVLNSLIQWNPYIGRIRYAWLSEDGTEAYILLKDGPSSWSEKKEEVLSYLVAHPYYKSHKVVERDPVYMVGTFDLTEVSDKKKEYIRLILEGDRAIKETVENYTMITDDPFDIFDKHLALLGKGELGGEMKRQTDDLAKKIHDAIEGGENIIIT